MIYLDYSATTPIDKSVLEVFNKACALVGNPNSTHKLGIEANLAIKEATKTITDLFGILPSELIYTSGASESNNLAIKGYALANQKKGKHIITSLLEHSSVIGPVGYLQTLGFEVDFVKLNTDGRVDLEQLAKLIRSDTILVSLASVNSEIGITQPIDEVAALINTYPNCALHVDMTQSVGKKMIDLTNVDLASFSAQKIYGFKGVGGLVKKDHITIEPLIHGGKSTTSHRSGTPATQLIMSLAKAIELAYDNEKKYDYISSLNKKLVEKLSKYKNVHINSNQYCLPHILNFSVRGTTSDCLQEAFSKHEVYISTQTACSSSDIPSRAVYALTNDAQLASSSVRVSLSHLTNEEDISNFLTIFDQIYQNLWPKNC